MNRYEYQSLIKWKEDPNRKPLLIRGARQVGKTWLMKEFGSRAFEKVAYINLEANPALKNVFATGFEISRIITALQIESGISIEPHNTLVILDEIQEVPAAITSLKYFQENGPEYAIMGAGSLLGVTLAKPHSFPVGKVDFLDLYPFTYIEFLEAIGEKPLADLIRQKDWTLITSFRERYIERLRQYYFTGGMPEAVQSFATDGDFNKVRSIQKRMLDAYEQDFSKHAPVNEVPRIRMVWHSIPAQLAKENRKFIYGQLRQGARAREFEMALAWLMDCGLLYKVTNISKPELPLKAYAEWNVFKLYMLDIGLLGAMTGLDARTLLEGNQVFSQFKGALTEQYVLQQLIGRPDLHIHYWSPGQSTAELDFLVQAEGRILPIEVKAEENLRAKSLKVFTEKYKPNQAIRTSMADYRKEDWMTNIPLYAIGGIV